MAELWFWLLALVLGIYAVLDGLDFGTGMLFFFIGQSEAERATLLRTIGPVWDGNEVWLVAAGGSLFAALPALYATAFSGFYLPLMVVLWLLLGRALGIEIRHQVADPMWHQFWDVIFSCSSWLLAVFFGAALGNVVRGVPLDEKGDFFEPLWTDFRVSDQVGILDWYTLLVAATAASLIAYHGALWIALKTERELLERAERSARLLVWPALALSLATTLSTLGVQPQASANLSSHRWGALLPVLSFVGLVASRLLLGRRRLLAFLASSAQLLLQVLSAAFAVFPQALAARDPRFHLTLLAAAASANTLKLMLWWWLPGMIVAVGYSYYNFSRMPRTFRVEEAGHDVL